MNWLSSLSYACISDTSHLVISLCAYMNSMTGRPWVCTWVYPIQHWKVSRWTIGGWWIVRWPCCSIGFALGQQTSGLCTLHWARWTNYCSKLCTGSIYCTYMYAMWWPCHSIHCSFFSLHYLLTDILTLQRFWSRLFPWCYFWIHTSCHIWTFIIIFLETDCTIEICILLLLYKLILILQYTIQLITIISPVNSSIINNLT